MLTALKAFFKLLLVPLIYFSGFGVMLASIFKEARWGLILLVFLIPQPNVWYKFHEYPVGKDFLDLLYFSVLIGIFIQKKGIIKSGNSILVVLFVVISYFALWNSSLRFSLPLPISTSNLLLFPWKNYAQMILLYVLVINIVKDEDQIKFFVILIAIVILFIAIRNYRNFDAGASFRWEDRAGGPFERVGLGANHFGAFIAFYCALLLGLFFFDENKKRRALYIVTYLFGLHPLFFSYSRGAYLAAFVSVIFYGFLKKKSLLILVILFLIAWQTILPPSVVERINMTKDESGELDQSSEHRIVLWEIALDAFTRSPIFGIGFAGFQFIVPEDERLKDTHNFFIKIICEQGIIGFTILLVLFYKAFKSGWILYKKGSNNFLKGLGFGYLGCIIACIVANLFGDRFSYFVMGSYFWILWGLVDRGIFLSYAKQDSTINNRLISFKSLIN